MTSEIAEIIKPALAAFESHKRLNRQCCPAVLALLQGQELVQNGKIKAKWFAVPGSGTGHLCRARRASVELKATLGKGTAERWIMGSKDQLPIQCAGRENMGRGACQSVLLIGSELIG